MLRRRPCALPRQLAARVHFSALAVLVLVCCGRTPVGQKPSPVAAHGYTTVGNAILDSTGAVRVFHGVNRPSLEWRVDGDHVSAADFQLMHDQWKSDIVRIPLNQDFWLQGAAQYDAGYRATVDQAVHWALAAGLHVILDLHWSDKGNLRGAPAAQQRMPDANSVTFWRQVAAAYKNETHVFFDLYNEPHDVSWEVWQRGGAVPDYTPAGGKTDSAYTAAGMQQLYDAVRGAGAENLVLVGGLDWGYDLSGVPQHRIAGHNIVYSTHPYEWKTDWQSRAFFLAATDPVFMGEFGAANCATKPYDDAIALADKNRMSWTAWAWWSGQPSQICGFPTILSDWNGTPSVMGAVVKAALARYLPSGMLPAATPASSGLPASAASPAGQDRVGVWGCGTVGETADFRTLAGAERALGECAGSARSLQSPTRPHANTPTRFRMQLPSSISTPAPWGGPGSR